MTRSEAINAYCRSCIHDPGAAGTWREQVGVCACVDCPLWKFRALPRHSPRWLASRDRKDMPVGFARLHHDDALAELRGTIDASVNGARVFHTPLATQDEGASPLARSASSDDKRLLRGIGG